MYGSIWKETFFEDNSFEPLQENKGNELEQVIESLEDIVNKGIDIKEIKKLNIENTEN